MAQVIPLAAWGSVHWVVQAFRVPGLRALGLKVIGSGGFKYGCRYGMNMLLKISISPAAGALLPTVQLSLRTSTCWLEMPRCLLQSAPAKSGNQRFESLHCIPSNSTRKACL